MNELEDPSALSCFVVAPIGKANSGVRERSDLVLHCVIRPALDEHYTITRADEVHEPGLITEQVIKRLLDADLIVADLAGSNANVFYELGVAHCHDKPCVLLMEQDAQPPFDVSNARAIPFDISCVRSVTGAVSSLRQHARTLRDSNTPPTNPVTTVKRLDNLQSTGGDIETMLVMLHSELSILTGQYTELKESISQQQPDATLREGLASLADLLRRDAAGIRKELRALLSQLEPAITDGAIAPTIPFITDRIWSAAKLAETLENSLDESTGKFAVALANTYMSHMERAVRRSLRQQNNFEKSLSVEPLALRTLRTAHSMIRSDVSSILSGPTSPASRLRPLTTRNSASSPRIVDGETNSSDASSEQ